MEDCDPVDIPMDLNHRLVAAAESYTPSKNQVQRYQSIVGRLMWPSTQSRPDISYLVGVLAKYLQRPDDSHLH